MASLRKRKTTASKNKYTKPPPNPNGNLNDQIQDSTPPSSVSDLEQCKQMFSFAYKYKYALIIHLLATLGHIIARMSFPIVIGFSITTLTANSDENIVISDGIMDFLCANKVILDCSNRVRLLNTAVYLMIYVNILQTLCNFIRGYFGKLIHRKISCEIRNKLFHCILWNDLSFFECNEQGKTGNLLNRLGNDCSTFASFVSQFSTALMDSLFGTVFGLIYALYLSYFMTFLFLFSVPISAMLSRYFANYYKHISQTVTDILANASNIALESIANIKTIKAFSAESNQELLYAKQVCQSYNCAVNIAFYKAIFEAIVSVLSFTSIACVLWYASKLYVSHSVNSGDIVTFLITAIQVSKFLQRLVGTYAKLMKSIGSTKRIFVLMNRSADITPFGGETAMKPISNTFGYSNPVRNNINSKNSEMFAHLTQTAENETFKGKIEFRKVCFAYPSRERVRIINDLSFTVESGQSIAIVGESGNGKSTIVDLLMRFYDPLSGQILIDGIDLRHYHLPQLRRHKIGYVSQEPSLFNKSIKWNICYAECGNGGMHTNFDSNKMMSAAKRAQCYDFVMELKDGFETVCGERGRAHISGGQKQRIAIARALYTEPSILVLDEALSALDAQNEYAIQHSFLESENNNEMTVIIIAHRLSTFKNVEKLFVIKQGSIVQSGSHNELIQNEKGDYFKLVQKQVFLKK